MAVGDGSRMAEGMAAWRRTRLRLPVERSLRRVMRPPDDVLPMGTDRNWADAIQYLRWEEDLGKECETPPIG